jgi:hypothetical protein
MKITRRTDGIDKVVASYPRDITVEPGANYPIAFMNDLGPMADDGTREHAIYPVPDKAFDVRDSPPPKAAAAVMTAQAVVQASTVQLAMAPLAALKTTKEIQAESNELAQILFSRPKGQQFCLKHWSNQALRNDYDDVSCLFLASYHAYRS